MVTIVIIYVIIIITASQCSSGCMLNCQVRGPRFKLRAEIWIRFLFHAHSTLPLGPQVSGHQSQSQAWNSPRARKRGSSKWVQILQS